MKKFATVTALALVAATATGCSTTAANTTPQVPDACLQALDAAETIFSAQADVTAANITLVEAIYPALESVLLLDPDGLVDLTEAVERSTIVTRQATDKISKSNYQTLRAECERGGN